MITLRKKINQLAHSYSVNKSKVIRKRLQEAKYELEQQYKVLEEEYITSLIEETECEFKASNTAKAWKVVNTISWGEETAMVHSLSQPARHTGQKSTY